MVIWGNLVSVVARGRGALARGKNKGAKNAQFMSRIHRLRSCGASGVRDKRGGNAPPTPIGKCRVLYISSLNIGNLSLNHCNLILNITIYV